MKKKLIMLLGLLIVSGGQGGCMEATMDRYRCNGGGLIGFFRNTIYEMIECSLKYKNAPSFIDLNSIHHHFSTTKLSRPTAGYNNYDQHVALDSMYFDKTTCFFHQYLSTGDFASAREVCDSILYQDRPAYAELSATLRHRVEEAIHKTRLLEEDAAATLALRTEVDAAHARLTEESAARAAADARNAELMHELVAMRAALAKSEDEKMIALKLALSLQESNTKLIAQLGARSQSHVRARTSIRNSRPAASAAAEACAAVAAEDAAAQELSTATPSGDGSARVTGSEKPTGPQIRQIRRSAIARGSNASPAAAQIAVAQDAAELASGIP